MQLSLLLGWRLISYERLAAGGSVQASAFFEKSRDVCRTCPHTFRCFILAMSFRSVSSNRKLSCCFYHRVSKHRHVYYRTTETTLWTLVAVMAVKSPIWPLRFLLENPTFAKKFFSTILISPSGFAFLLWLQRRSWRHGSDDIYHSLPAGSSLFDV